MKVRSFKSVSTSTPGKIEYEAALIKQLPYHHRGEKIITLIGAVDGLDRQLSLLTSKGADMSDIIVVERDLETYKSLDCVKSKFGFKLIFGDFFNVLENTLNNGIRFSLVDFDGTEGIGLSTMTLVALCSVFYQQINRLHIVTSARTAGEKAKECESMASDLGLPEVCRKSYIRKAHRDASVPPCGYKTITKYAAPVDVFTTFVNERTKLRVINKTIYKGRQTMYAFMMG